MIKSLSIIFPVYNEQIRLNESLNKIKLFLKKKNSYKIEIIFVDDGSTDNTEKILKNFVKIYKKNKKFKISYLKSIKNFGKGHALSLGVKKAKYEWILTSDIDHSVPLEQINTWIKRKLLIEKKPVYFASRTHKDSLVVRNFFRKILGDLMGLAIILILGLKWFDTQCGFKLYTKKIAKKIFLKLKCKGFEHDVEIVLHLKTMGIDFEELPIHWVHKDNSTLNILTDPIKMLIGIVLIKFRF